MTETIQRAARAILPLDKYRSAIANIETFSGMSDALREAKAAAEMDVAKQAATDVIETLLDPSEEAVLVAAQKLKPWAFSRAEDMTDKDWELCESERRQACNVVRACIRAYHMKVLGR